MNTCTMKISIQILMELNFSTTVYKPWALYKIQQCPLPSLGYDSGSSTPPKSRDTDAFK